MKKIILVAIAFLMVLPAIAKMHKQKKKKASGNDIVSVQLYQTGCYGRCPTYSVEINQDGFATYTAIRFNADSGAFRKKIGKEKAMEVINEVAMYRVDTCKDRYENHVPDLPGINFTIKYRTKTKYIDNAKYGPSYLSHLGKVIEDAGLKTDDKGWERVKIANAR